MRIGREGGPRRSALGAARRTAPGAGASGRGGWRALPWARIAVIGVLALAVIGAVPPLRRAAAVAASKAVLVAFSPIAPGLGDFDSLSQGSRVLAADGSLLTELDGALRREPLRLSALPRHVTRAVLAAEDANFYDHGGVDPSAVFRAFVRTAQGSRQGGSTITQQLAKLNYTNSERTLLRKLREVQYAVRLEKEYSKDELLERYLNQVYFGDGAYGLAAASQLFFATDPERLSPAQAATLAGKIKAPEALDPRAEPEPVKARRDQVLGNMHRRGWLGDAELRQALASPLELAPPSPAAAGRAPYFVEYVKKEAAGLDELGGSPESRGKQLFTGGYTIKTTLDPAALDAAASSVQSALPDPGDPEAAVASVVPGDGAIRVLYGGRNFQERKFDLASQGRRQPGSSFKPFVYLAAVADGIDPRSSFDASSPRQFEYRGERYTVDNYEGEGGGRSTLDNAMTHSINTVFAQLILDVGPPKVVRAAEQLGVDDVDENVGSRAAIALGGLRTGVTPLEQAAAFAAFAARGKFAEPYAIAEITDRKGRTVYRRRPATEQTFEANEVGVLNAALQGVIRSGTGRAADIGRPAAGKTGTTQEYGDGWFVGFVPQLSTAVWVGHPDGIVPMKNVHGRPVTGGSFPAEIWAGTMRQAVASLPPEEIFTASPDSLGLKPLRQPPPSVPAPPVAPSSTLPPAPTTTTAVPPGGAPLSVPNVPFPASTTTTAPRRAPTTTPQTSTTTTAPPPPTTTSTTTTTPPTTTTTVPPTTTTTRAP